MCVCVYYIIFISKKKTAIKRGHKLICVWKARGNSFKIRIRIEELRLVHCEMAAGKDTKTKFAPECRQ